MLAAYAFRYIAIGLKQCLNKTNSENTYVFSYNLSFCISDKEYIRAKTNVSSKMHSRCKQTICHTFCLNLPDDLGPWRGW